MKRKLIIVVCFCATLHSYSQKKAVTETGDEVILYDNGTWKYLDEEIRSEERREIPVNTRKFEKSEEANFLLKSKKIDFGFWLNPKKWSFEKGSNNGEAEYELQLRGEDLYAMIISEKIEIPIENLKEIALENAKKVSSDIKVVHEEYRNVNGLRVLFMKMNGTLQGIKFSYYGYYFSGPEGTLQFLTYTSQNLLVNYIDECEELINGLVALEQ